MQYTSVERALTPDETKERMQRWMNRKDDGEFGIWLAEKHEGDFVGWFMLKPNDDHSLEIGFMILQELWGQGLTKEIAERLIDHAGERRVTARVHPANTASLKVLEKLGFHVVNVEGETVHLTRVR
jgi:ribosomal-protein-alanine N-acetyltransferase